MTMAHKVDVPEYLTIPELGYDLTVIETAPNGAKVLFRKPYSNRFGDNFLERVVAWWHDKFVIWYWNHQTGGMCDGHYFLLFQYEGNMLAALNEALHTFDALGPPTQIGEYLDNYIVHLDTKEAANGR
jgi:hypothetical protein